MPPKRQLSVAAHSGNGTAAAPWKRPRAALGSSSSRILEPPPSPAGKRLRAVLLVVLFLKNRPKNRSADTTIPSAVSLQFGRLVMDQLCQFFTPMFSKLESKIESRMGSMEDRIQDLTQKVENTTRPHPNHCYHERTMQEANQEGIGAKSQGLAKNDVRGKSTSIRLRFLNGMKTPVYHDDEIKSDSNAPLKIGIFDGHKMIKSGLLSKAKVKILALEGNFPYDSEGSWTAKEFNEHIAGGRNGKGDVLEGEGTNVQLINGECDLSSIRFREGSCRAREGKFIVGARVRDGEANCDRVQEAVMKSVVVQDRRNKANEKSHPPKLSDRVHRLEGISEHGNYCKRLQDEEILTVEHFLKALNKDPNILTRILKIKKGHRSWENMIRHARECSLEGKHKLKSYPCTEKNVKLFFDCVHHLVGATFSGGHYIPSDKFNPYQQVLVDELKKGAYAELDNLPEDYVMTADNSSNPIRMDAYAGAGPSYMPNATHKTCSGDLAAHQAGGAEVTESSTHAQIEPSCANTNNDPGPSSSTADLCKSHNYQGHIQTPCAVANIDAVPRFSVPGSQITRNYQDTLVSDLADQGTQFADQGQFSYFSDLCEYSLGMLNSSPGTIGEFSQYEGYGMAFLQHQPDINNNVEMQPHLLWPCNGTLEATTSAHSNITWIQQQCTTNGGPVSASASMQSQGQASLRSNGASEALDSAPGTCQPVTAAVVRLP